MRALRKLPMILPWAMAFLVLYLMTSVYSRVGPPADELWNLYSSPLVGLGGDWTKVTIDVWGVPIVLLTGPYHGAIKANLFVPLLALTRSLDAIRLANCALLLFIIPIYLWGMRPIEVDRPLNRIYAALSVFLIPALYINIPLDTGQLIVPSLLVALALAATIRAQFDANVVYCWVAYAAGLLSVYEKLTQLNFVTPICAYSLYLLLRKQFNYKTVLAAGALPLIIFSPYLMYFIFYGGWTSFTTMTTAPSSSFANNLSAVIQSMSNIVFSFGEIYILSAYFGESPRYDASGYVIIFFALVSIAACLTGALFGRRRKWDNRGTKVQVYLWFVFLSSILVQSLVNGLNRPWHFSTYWILLIFIIGAGLQQLSDQAKLRKLVFVAIAIGGIVSAFSFVRTWIFVKNHQSISTASSAILDVASFLSKNDSKVSMVCVDYSVCYPLGLLLGDKVLIRADYSFSARDKALVSHIDAAMDRNNTVLILRQIEAKVPADHLRFLNDGSQTFLRFGNISAYSLLGSFDDHAGTKFQLYRKLKSN